MLRMKENCSLNKSEKRSPEYKKSDRMMKINFEDFIIASYNFSIFNMLWCKFKEIIIQVI